MLTNARRRMKLPLRVGFRSLFYDETQTPFSSAAGVVALVRLPDKNRCGENQPEHFPAHAQSRGGECEGAISVGPGLFQNLEICGGQSVVSQGGNAGSA